MYTEFGAFKTGSSVKENGWYVCVPCGYKRYLKIGDKFPQCLKCLGEDKEEFASGFELWEKVKAFVKKDDNKQPPY